MKYILITTILFLSSSCIYYDIRDNKAVTEAIVMDFGDTRSGTYLIYKYNVGGKEYESSHNARFSRRCLSKFKYKKFVLLYSTKNPQNNMMLVTRSNYEHWGMRFPDSLKWVQECFP